MIPHNFYFQPSGFPPPPPLAIHQHEVNYSSLSSSRHTVWDIYIQEFLTSERTPITNHLRGMQAIPTDLGDGKSLHNPPDLKSLTLYCPLLASGTALARRGGREEKLGLG